MAPASGGHDQPEEGDEGAVQWCHGPNDTRGAGVCGAVARAEFGILRVLSREFAADEPPRRLNDDARRSDGPFVADSHER